MKTITLPGGPTLPALGQGTWKLGEDAARARDEAAALQLGVDLGMTVIDTAEMYGSGATERFVHDALGHRRDEIFLVSKFYPQNASTDRLPRACEGSLKRLGTDRIDLYLLHWPGSTPLAETVDALERLVAVGKIRSWGVSNFDVSDMEELIAAGGKSCAINQVLYNLTRRGPDYDLAGWLHGRSIPLMAYSPVEQGRLPKSPALDTIARHHGVEPIQVALAWTMRSGALAVPKASTLNHVRANRAAADLDLTDHDLALLDTSFASPKRKVNLEML